jgi:hypothetical protein
LIINFSQHVTRLPAKDKLKFAHVSRDIKNVHLTKVPVSDARALIRDNEWIVQNAAVCHLVVRQLSRIGISETVRNPRALFLVS